MAGNVHKDEVTAVKIPQIATTEDRGLSRCKKPIKVLASLTDTSRYKNDLTGIALRADSLTVELEDEAGNTTPALGTAVTFPYQSNAVGFVIDWRQITKNGGTEIAVGCYKVKVSGTISGIPFSYYYAAFDLKVWTIERARYTVQVFSVLNDLVRKDAINYRDSGFCNSIRFRGSFGFMQPNYDTTNQTQTDRVRNKVNNEALRTYELRSSYIQGCLTEIIDAQHLLAANQIWITEHNPLAHIQYQEFPVIVDRETSPSLEYTEGQYAKLLATFKDKVAVHQSKYDGNIQGSENVSFNLPQGLVCTSGGNTGSFVGVVNKTGQETTRALYDDGYFQYGNGTSWDTMRENNVFGNTNAFTDLNGGQTYSDNIMLCHNTDQSIEDRILGFYMTSRVDSATNALNTCFADTWGGFNSGWHLPNSNELRVLKRSEGGTLGYAFNWSPLNENFATYYWCSDNNSANNYYSIVNNGAHTEVYQSSGINYRYLSCRWFTYDELGL